MNGSAPRAHLVQEEEHHRLLELAEVDSLRVEEECPCQESAEDEEPQG